MPEIEGLTTIPSRHGPRETADRLAAAVTVRGMTLFARIDHAAGAAAAGLALRPTEVLVFGNARAGTGPMQQAQTLGLDLPLRALVWEDEAGGTWISANEPAWLGLRHGLGASPALAAMTAALAAVMREAAGHDTSAA